MDTESLVTSPVMVNETPESSKGKVISTILGLVFIVFVGVSSYILGAKSAEPANTGVMPTLTATATPTGTATVILTPTATPTMTVTPVVSTQSNVVSIGKNSKITLPTGWFVSGIVTEYKAWTKEEMNDFMDDSFKNAGGSIPIHKFTKVTLRNASKSMMTIEVKAIYAFGDFGYGPLEELSSVEKVIVAPTATLNGFSRVLKGGIYTYHAIVKCSGDNDLCKNVAPLPEELSIKFEFTGKSSDLAVADKFYKDNLLNKTVNFTLN